MEHQKLSEEEHNRHSRPFVKQTNVAFAGQRPQKAHVDFDGALVVLGKHIGMVSSVSVPLLKQVSEIGWVFVRDDGLAPCIEFPIAGRKAHAYIAVFAGYTFWIEPTNLLE